MGDLDKKSIQDRIKQAYRNAPGDDDKTVKATVIENDTANPAPVEDVHSQNVKIYNLTVDPGDENSELSQALINGARQLIIRVRKKVDTTVKVSFEANGTTTGDYWEIESGGYLEIKKINLIGKTLYYNADKPNRTIEILATY